VLLDHSASQRRIFACGSIVLADLNMCDFWRGAQKIAHHKKYRSAEGEKR
jgi:hypothetical protein